MITGPLGDFIIHSQMGDPPQSVVIECEPPAVEGELIGAAALREQPLWSDVFGEEAYGMFCDDDLIAINNGMGTVDGSSNVVLVRYPANPLLALMDAPRDRIELIEIDGYEAVIQHPLEGFPFAYASLAMIIQQPDGDEPGLAAYVNGATSAERAIELARAVIPAEAALSR